MSRKMWQGRFQSGNDPLMEKFNRSLGIDAVMAEEDIRGSIAWSKAIEKAGIISKVEGGKLRKTLEAFLKDKDNLTFLSSDEDIHMAIERLLTEKLGALGKKIHTGRSRNDQVALDTRLYMKKLSRSIRAALLSFMKTVLTVAEREKGVIMPAFTHLQAAQPVSMGHYFLCWFSMLERDYSRFVDCETRFDAMPLASGALTGSGFRIDRELLRKELGFARVTDNSMDAVADRDYLIEFLSACSITSMHLSRFAEDMIIFCSPGYRYFELADAYSTGSSMMPNKKNPDSMELVRGKTGRIYGALVNLLTVTKGLPLTYNKDLQEDKAPVFDSAETLQSLLKIFEGVLSTVKVNRERIAESLPADMLATDMADILVENGLPFRDAHEVVGRIVLECTKTGKKLTDFTSAELAQFSKHMPKNVNLSFKGALERRNLYGGTGLLSVAAQIRRAKMIFTKFSK